MTVELHLGDCRDWIPKVAADLVVTDPPYDVKTRGGGGIMNERPYIVNGELHSMDKGMPEGVLEACIAMTSNVYVWGNWASIRRYLPTAEGYSTNLLSWHKSNPIPACKNKYLNDTEYCLFIRRDRRMYGGFADHRTWWVTPLNTADKRRYGHPTVKPLDIIRTMVRNSCPPGGTVFDPFMGTGTTGVAAIMEGRSFVGCEIDPRWYAVAEARIAEAQASVRDGNNNE